MVGLSVEAAPLQWQCLRLVAQGCFSHESYTLALTQAVSKNECMEECVYATPICTVIPSQCLCTVGNKCL